MSSESDDTGDQELHYFGKVSASVSHELKNVLAILNEHAGLLQDYAVLAERGQALDVERIRRLSATMLGQIARGDAIVKRMNRFAHSADRERASVDLHGLATLVVDMFARIATTRGVTVEVQTDDAAGSLRTHPFALETLLGSLIDRLTAALPDIGVLRIQLRSQADAATVSIPGLFEHAGTVTGLTELGDIKALLATLHAQAGFDLERGELVITLPGDIDA